MRNRIRVIAAVAATAALTAGSTTAAMASPASTRPAAHAKTVSTSYRCAPDSDLAARLGVSSARLDHALRALKVSLGKTTGNVTEDQFDAALAHLLGIAEEQVRPAFAAEKACGSKPVSGKATSGKSGAQQGDAALAAAVARQLHVSTAAVSAALQPLFAAGYADPSSPTFAAAAKALGVSPQQLANALSAAKKSLADGN